MKILIWHGHKYVGPAIVRKRRENEEDGVFPDFSSPRNSWSLFWSLVASRYFFKLLKGRSRVRAITLKSSKTEAGLSLTSITLITAAAVAIIKLFYANASRYRGTDEFFFLYRESRMLIT